MPYEGYVDPITNDGHGFHSNMTVSELTERVTRVIKVTLPKPFFIYLHDHSFIISHTRIRIFIHARIHSFIPCIQSIAYAIDASQHFVLRHEAVVASFNMSND